MTTDVTRASRATRSAVVAFASRIFRFAALVGVPILLVAGGCGGGGDVGSDSAQPAPGDSAAGPPSAMHVTLTGGKHAGSYDAEAAQPTCSVGANEQDLWSAQYVNDTATTGLGSLQVMIPNAERAKAGTDTFYFAMVIGSFLQGDDYLIESRPGTRPSGHGTAKVDDSGTSATITVTGVTGDSVGVEAVIRCETVKRGR